MDKNNKILKKAVALRYDQTKDNAPKVIASGKGQIANKIIQMAEKSGVPVYEDKALVEMLSCLELNEEIPIELYEIVAEILVFIYSLDNKQKTNK